MAGNFALALIVLFLLMAALFRSPRDSAMVVLAMPLATGGRCYRPATAQPGHLPAP